MFNPPKFTEQDRNEAAKRERAKQIEEERRPRIFNARQRILGVDMVALNKQIQEKEALKQLERDQEKAYYKKQVSDNIIAESLERTIRQDKKKQLLETIQFRQQFQKREDSRDFDLNDPNALRKSLPCRLLDDDPRISISSVQKFEGEDGVARERMRVQKEQQRAWLLQQMAEKKKCERERESAEKLYCESLAAQEDRALFMEATYGKLRKELEVANLRYNQALAVEQGTAKKLQELRELEDNRQEIYNAITSDFLTENPDVAQSSLGLDKIIGACYKGMTPAQKEAIKNKQMEQIEERKERKKESDAFDKKWVDINNTMAQKKLVEELTMEKERKKRLKELFKENDRIREEHRAQQEYLNKVVYTNVPTAAFYEQFNKTTR